MNPARRLTYRIRARVPKRAETAVRRVMLRWGMLVYDALYLWSSDASEETHRWIPPLAAVEP